MVLQASAQSYFSSSHYRYTTEGQRFQFYLAQAQTPIVSFRLDAPFLKAAYSEPDVKEHYVFLSKRTKEPHQYGCICRKVNGPTGIRENATPVGSIIALRHYSGSPLYSSKKEVPDSDTPDSDG